MRTQIFISYRRDGGLAAAARLCELLSDEYEVFFDMKSLRSGRFDVAIEKAIADCSDFLLILSNNIFARMEEDGDWIFRELQLALKKNKNIIPIFLEEFSFPQTDNPYIDLVKNYNGVAFGESDVLKEKLSLFLISSPKRVLSIACNPEGYYLTQESIETLKALYRDIADQAQCDIRVSLEFPNAAEAALCLLSREEREDPTALFVKQQQLLRRRLSLCPITERAIEYMLWDQCNCYDPDLRIQIRKHPLSQEGFYNGNGIFDSYEVVAYWVGVIDIFLKEFTCEWSRVNRYGNDSSLDKIYAYFDSKDPWANFDLQKQFNFSFFCFVPKNECGLAPDTRKKRRLTTSFSAQTLISQVIPDFYYAVATLLLEKGNEALKEEICDPQSRIYNLCYYRYLLD